MCGKQNVAKKKKKNETTKLTTCAGNFCKLLLTENTETWYNFDFWIGSSFFPGFPDLLNTKVRKLIKLCDEENTQQQDFPT